ERIDLEEDVFERGRGDDAEKQRNATDAEHEADAELPRALIHDHAQNAKRISTECHTNSELLRALIDGEAHHAIQADPRKNKSDHAKDGEEGGDHAVSGEDIVVELRGSAREVCRQI